MRKAYKCMNESEERACSSVKPRFLDPEDRADILCGASEYELQ